MNQLLLFFLYFFLLMIFIFKTYGAKPKLVVNCINGKKEEECANGGSCRRVLRKGKYFADGQVKKHSLIQFTYCDCLKMWGGRTCTEENTCYYNKPCIQGHHSGCYHVSPSDFRCICKEKWTGKTCETERNYTIQRKKEDNPCRSNPCHTGARGRCLVVRSDTGQYDGYKCICYERFTGVHCETARDCREGNDHCQNGGSCIFKSKSGMRLHAHTCLCSSSYTGFRCETPIRFITIQDDDEPAAKRTKYDPCQSEPCENGATCHALVNIKQEDDSKAAYKCECLLQYTGEHCQFLRSCDDDDDQCLNGGSCVLTHNKRISALTWECKCPQFYTGYRCEIELFSEFNPIRCDDGIVKRNADQPLPFERKTRSGRNPCKNDGLCIIKRKQGRQQRWTCLCVKGTSGKRCNIGCPHGSYGAGCQQKCNNCEDDVCDIGDGSCTCKPGWTGEGCQDKNGLGIELRTTLQDLYKKRFENKSSTEYKDLYKDVETWVEGSCDAGLGISCDMYQMNVTSGSVVLDYKILFGEDTSSKNTSRQLLKSLQKTQSMFNKASGYNILAGSINIRKVEDFSSSANIWSKSKVGFTVLIFCAVGIIISVFIIVIIRKKQKRLKLHRIRNMNIF